MKQITNFASPVFQKKYKMMSGGLHYTVVDGGEGLASDSIMVNDGIREYPVHLLDGDLTISTGK